MLTVCETGIERPGRALAHNRGAAGLQRVQWNLRNSDDALVKPGEYTVTLRVGRTELARKMRVDAPP